MKEIMMFFLLIIMHNSFLFIFDGHFANWKTTFYHSIEKTMQFSIPLTISLKNDKCKLKCSQLCMYARVYQRIMLFFVFSFGARINANCQWKQCDIQFKSIKCSNKFHGKMKMSNENHSQHFYDRKRA